MNMATVPEIITDSTFVDCDREDSDRSTDSPERLPFRERAYSISVADTAADEFIVGRSVKTRVLDKINAGAFGEIHLGELVEGGKQVAVKLEQQSCPHPQLLSEGNIYRHLEGGPGIPRVHWYGLHEPLYNVLVMDLLGPSLQDLFVYCGRKFSVKTTLLLVDQMLSIIEYFHKHQYLHRDIKPDNFMMGLGENVHKVYIIDLGLTKKLTTHRFSISQIAISQPMVGTVRYSSVNAHLHQQEGPRDDLESLAYVWAYFLRGSLPWQGVQARNREEKFSKICNMKKTMKSDELFAGFPTEFARYLDYTKRMHKDERPSFSKVRNVFIKLAEHNEIVYDFEFDWTVKQRETGEPVKTCTSESHSGVARSDD